MINVLAVILGFCSGVLVSGAVFAFITIVGVVPRLAQKTKTQRYIRVYETALALGGIIGLSLVLFVTRLPGWMAFTLPIFGLMSGIFYGALAMSLAEVLDVIPILARRVRLQRGLFFIVLAIAIGKTTGALLYFLMPGFFK
jgi:stage V sporulation protein AB